MGGINSWEFIPSKDVLEIPPTINGRIFYEVVLKTGARWFEGYGTEGTMNFVDEQQDGDHGGYQVKAFSCRVPKMRASLSDTLDRLMNQSVILILTYNNGTKILAGNIKEPLYLRSKHDSKGDVLERNEFEVYFTGEGVHKSPVYMI